MSEIVYPYSRQKREFGRTPEFQEYPAEVLVDIAPNTEVAQLWIKTDAYETEVQCVPELSERSTNTERRSLTSRGQLHVEGGWPKEIDVGEEEHKVRYRKKAEKEDWYVSSTKALVAQAEVYIKQNNAVDIYEDYFVGPTPEDMDCNSLSVKTVTVLGDPCGLSKRTPTYLSWVPSDGKKLAIAYCNLGSMVPNSCSSTLTLGEPITSFIWDTNNPNSPEMTLDPPSPLTCLQYNPKEVYTLAGGAYNGLLCQFDVRSQSKPVMKSEVDNSHHNVVYDIKWLNKPTEFMSVSTDGSILMWDTKKLSEPFDSIVLKPKSGMMQNHGRSTLHGGLCIDYNTAIGGSSKFMVGTEQGAALTCTRRGKSATDRVVAAYKGHHGPVYAVERNIMCPKFFLTVGDWRAHIWMEEIRHPIVSTTYHSAYLTDGAWHPLRPAVFFTTQTDGTLNVWDLLYNQNNPLLSIQVADAGLHCMKVHPNGQMLALGTTKNAVHLRQLGAGLCNPVRDEKSLVGAILERETQRERNIVLRQKELRGKAKRASVLDEETDANYFQPDEAFYYEITTDYITALEEAGIETVTILKNKESLQATKVQSASPAPLRTEGTEY